MLRKLFCLHLLIRPLWICLFTCLLLLTSAPSPAQETKITLAILPGEGPREPGPEIIARVEVVLSKQPGLALLEREQVRRVIRELALASGGFLDPAQSPRLGQILGAQIIIFIERMPVNNGFVDRYRLVDTKTGIVMDTLFEEENAEVKDAASVIRAVERARQKSLVPLEQRNFVSLLELRNTEPGTTLDGTAEALQMFLSNDLALAPNVFVLDREHLQRLQDEQTLSTTDLRLKSSAFLIEGGIQHTPDRSSLQVDIFLHNLAGNYSSHISLQVGNDIQKIRQLLQQRVLEQLHAEAPVEVKEPGNEAGMFLKRVAPLILAAQYEEAVRAAEVAYALQPGRDTAFWASRAWYFLGKDLRQQLYKNSGAVRSARRPRLKRATDDIGDQFTPSAERMRPQIRREADNIGDQFVPTRSGTRTDIPPQSERLNSEDKVPATGIVRPANGPTDTKDRPALAQWNFWDQSFWENLGKKTPPRSAPRAPVRERDSGQNNPERSFEFHDAADEARSRKELYDRSLKEGQDFTNRYIPEVANQKISPAAPSQLSEMAGPQKSSGSSNDRNKPVSETGGQAGQEPLDRNNWKKQTARTQMVRFPEETPETSEQKKRLFDALLRAVQLGQEFTVRYIRDFTAEQVSDLPIPDPFVEPATSETERNTRLEEDMTLWSINIPLGENATDLRDIQNSLIAAETSLLATQRAFYLGLSDKDARAVISYWKTWQQEGALCRSVSMSFPKLGLLFYQNVFAAFPKNTAAFPKEKAEGFSNAIRLPPAYTPLPEAAAFLESLPATCDPFLRMAAGRLLLRVDPAHYAGEVLRAYLALQDEAGTQGTALAASDKLFADFLTPAINHLAVYQPEELLSLGGRTIDPVLKSNDAGRLTAWQPVLWPYLNALAQAADKQPALELITRCQDILKAVPVADTPLTMNRLRAELDLKLVWIGGKKEVDPSLQQYFFDPGTPAYLRQRAEIEPPHPEGPLDLTGFGQLPMIYGQKYRSTISSVTNRGHGVSSKQSYERTVDAEGNEFFSTYSLQAQSPKADTRLVWAGYEVIKMDVQLATTTYMPWEADGHNLFCRNMLLDDGSLYVVITSPDDKSLKFSAWRHSLTLPQTKHLLGVTRLPLPPSNTAVLITSVAAGGDKFFVGTSAGLLVYPASASLPADDGDRSSLSAGPTYIPYAVEKAGTTATTTAGSQPAPRTAESGESGPQLSEAVDLTYRLDVSNGLPDNHVLSLAWLDGRLYIATGPEEEFTKDIRGVSGLLAYDPASKKIQVLASSRALNSPGPLDQGQPYQIKALLPDQVHKCLWLAIGGNKELNGIWRYDVTSGQTTPAVREELSVLDLQWAGEKIIYAMYQSGWSMYDPQTEEKTWLMGYTVSAWTGVNPPQPPRGITGQPLYGFPKTRLWPYAPDGRGNIITVGWDAFDLIRQGKSGPTEPLKKLDPQANYVSGIAYITQNRQDIWVVTYAGQVFRLTPQAAQHLAPAAGTGTSAPW